ncbi:hypothetical protein IFU23_05905 [Pantoea agglomerans]|nr:hypothetical protein [Pantoea agglomerans]MBD8152300.1 hypothetical protein [Pantoea agglomerans]MBD8157640.1 hypothetical protein [Pantoea agglomerans]MBD8231479.1 hypothetical protein [Pantoea agglomerans]MBD8241828.1 hypothetical protein [Pantoea agglomerans]WVL84050.1 hypothetical protein IFU02_016350 [Pantoea agglomerans]
MKRELRYGGNVEWFLNDIAAVEMSDIDSGEFEIYGEDEAGREACTYIDITELAADAAQMIGELRDQLQAAEHLAELLGRQNLDTQRKLDALAAENAALSRYFSASAGAVEHWNSWADAEDKLASVPETPATDAYLNSVRAEGIHFAANRMMAAWESGFIDDTPAHVHDISGAVLSALEFLPSASSKEFKRDYADKVRSAIAAQLRAVKDGE